MLNKIYLKRKNKIMLNKKNSQLHPVYLASFIKNLEELGYTLSEDVINVLKTYDANEIGIVYDELIKELKELKGIRKYKPMYPKFPRQVMSMSEAEIYLNALYHYITLKKPIEEIDIKKAGLWDRVNLEIIELGSYEELNKIFKNLVSSTTSLSEEDKVYIKYFFEEYKDESLKLLPEEIPFKETAIIVSKLIIDYCDEKTKSYKKFIKTPTDILRLYIAFSDGDISLAEKTKMKNLKRKNRRIIMELLEGMENPLEEMFKKRMYWIRLGEKLHPFEYKKIYKKAFESFDFLRNKKKPISFYGQIDSLLNMKKYEDLINLLKTRPGEFARKIDFIARNKVPYDLITEALDEVVGRISTPVLIQLRAHFKNRARIQNDDFRIFMPKGNMAKLYGVIDYRENLPIDFLNNIIYITEKSLLERFSIRKSLGNVYVDSRLSDFTVPFSQRSASKSLKTISRGSKIQISKNTIRFFLWWKEGIVEGKNTGRVDIDLSAMIYDENWDYLDHISYTNLKSKKLNACHSGDIVTAPNGACEFIDIDIRTALQHGARYVVMSINAFSEHFYCDLPECFVGWMEREFPESGEIFEPITVSNKIDISSKSKIAIPMIVDLKEAKAIWADIALKNNNLFYNNVEGNEWGIKLVGKAMLNFKRPNLYDLFTLHAKSRGVLVEEKSQADTIFSIEKGITPWDTDEIVGDFI